MPSRAPEKVLFEAIWARAEPALPPRTGLPKGGRPWASDWDCLWGIIFLLRSGCRWNDLDNLKGWPLSATRWRRYAEWTKAGVWDRLFKIVLDEYHKTVGSDVREQFGDATFVEDRKRGVLTGTTQGEIVMKFEFVTDARGSSVVVVVEAAHAAETDLCAVAVDHLPPRPPSPDEHSADLRPRRQLRPAAGPPRGAPP